ACMVPKYDILKVIEADGIRLPSVDLWTNIIIPYLGTDEGPRHEIQQTACAHALVLRGHTDWVKSAAFNPDGNKVITASDDHTARIWNSSTGQLLHTLSGHTRWINSAAFSPDGNKVVTASADHTARIWNSSNGQLQ